MMKPILLVITGLCLITLMFTQTSCNKNTDCKATVKCVDSLNNPVDNAAVLLYATVKSSVATYTADLKANGNTDGNGEVKFTFKLPAIFDVRATYTKATKTYTGSAIIKLEEGQTVSKVVSLTR
jgi:hypothetical protein